MSDKQSPSKMRKPAAAPAKAAKPKAKPRAKAAPAPTAPTPATFVDASNLAPTDEPIQLPLSEETFCREYLIDFNASRAYRAVHPNCKASTASVEGARTLAKPRVAARLAELAHKRAEKLEIDADELLRQANAIANADHRHLSQYVRTCCRHCYGREFGYQRTAGEMKKARAKHEQDELDREAKAMLRNKDFTPKEFDEEGGDGYDGRLDPNPDCPECFGHGVGRMIIADTRKLPPDAAILFAGVEETKDGLKIKAHDKQKAQDMLYRNKGLYEKDNSQRAAAVSPEALAALAARMDETRARQLVALNERRGDGFPGN